ncbi:MAG: PilZ domain-containing protein [Candidatus Scalindua sediminis]|nr:PilZ domain-containing protein [Candidatus Scalindua sediminis]HDY69129.1 hypothetical protein [Candidatus Scalindua sp.]
MYKGQERREYKRREKLYMSGVRVKQHEGLETGSTGWDSVTLHNLSAGGTSFTYKKDLGIGILLDLKIDVPIKLIDIGEQEKEAIYTAVAEALEQANKTSVA